MSGPFSAILFLLSVLLLLDLSYCAKTKPVAAALSPKEVKDIIKKGNCSAEIKRYCADVKQGDGRLVNCISEKVKTEKAGNDEAGVTVSDECKTEIRAFKVNMYKELTMDKPMQDACKSDIKKYCDDDFLYPEPGNVLACLREVEQVDKVSEACKKKIFEAKKEAADDFRLDPQLNELCSADAIKFCKGVEPGEGRMQTCLREHVNSLAWDCQAELFRQDVENADDIRLNAKLFQACVNDKKKFCPEIQYGNARVKDCLEEHRLEADFSPRCKVEFDKMMARRASDFRLDSNLRKYCKQDISEICYPDAEDVTDVANWDAKVIQCLQDYRDELKNGKCKDQVHKLTARAAEDFRFDRPLYDACLTDRQTICKDVSDGMAHVFRCFEDHFDQLKEACANAVFEQLVRFSEELDFKLPMKRACGAETKKFCKDIQPGRAALIECLQSKVDDPDMGDDCKKEVKRDEIRSAEDYRLNFRLNRACFNDIQKTCLHACDSSIEAGKITCGGSVLKCLQENTDKLESETCKKEVFAFEEKVAKDVRLDIPLQNACKPDLKKLCPAVTKDHTKQLSCLRRNREALSKDCRHEEMRFSIMEASDIRLTPTLMNACGQELQLFCKKVPPMHGLAFRCLQQNLDKVEMGAACKGQVNLEEVRHASNYRLDASLAQQCENEANTICQGADQGQEGYGLMQQCFVKNYKDLTAGCKTEVGYAVKAALWQYKKGSPLTSPCDEDLNTVCMKVRPKEVNGVVNGVYGQCLLSVRPKKLSAGCRQLALVVPREGAFLGQKFDDETLQATLAKIEELKAMKNGTFSGKRVALKGSNQLVASGWIAYAGIISFLVVLAVGGLIAYRHFYGIRPQYTAVPVKGGDI